MPVIPSKRKRSPMSSGERSRRFRERHPTYHADWKRQQRAETAADGPAHLAAFLAQVATPVEAEVRTPLMLPAPQPPEFDLLEQLAAARARAAEFELVLASHARS